MPNFDRYVKKLYHFTDVSNLPSIVEYGGLFSWSKLNETGILVPTPGGNDWSHDADERSNVDQHVHLCFRNEHPMEWRARQDGRLPDAVFLEIDRSILDLDGVLFTDDVSNKAGVVPITRVEANEQLDFEVLFGNTDWRDPAVQERLKRAKKYEVLVPDFVSLDYILNLDEFEF